MIASFEGLKGNLNPSRAGYASGVDKYAARDGMIAACVAGVALGLLLVAAFVMDASVVMGGM